MAATTSLPRFAELVAPLLAGAPALPQRLPPVAPILTAPLLTPEPTPTSGAVPPAAPMLACWEPANARRRWVVYETADQLKPRKRRRPSPKAASPAKGTDNSSVSAH